MNRTNTALLCVLVAAAIAIFAGIRLAAPPEPSSSATVAQPGRPDPSDTRPSPVAESVDVAVRPRRAPEPPPQQQLAASVQAATSTDTSKDWSVVAATMSSSEQAGKRARSLKDAWPDCACKVFPNGESDHYFVVVGTGLDRNSADRLRDRATAAGLPPDTYVTKLIFRAGDRQP